MQFLMFFCLLFSVNKEFFKSVLRVLRSRIDLLARGFHDLEKVLCRNNTVSVQAIRKDDAITCPGKLDTALDRLGSVDVDVEIARLAHATDHARFSQESGSHVDMIPVHF